MEELDKLAQEYELRIDVEHWGGSGLNVTLEVWRAGARFQVDTIAASLSAALAELIPAVRTKMGEAGAVKP